jgi:tartronate-semialdehyde synthase
VARMPVMDAVVHILEDEGVEVAFGIPGAAILPMYKSLSRSRRIRHLTVRHEEGATHAADGYARASGRVGVAIGTSGPAGTNMITGLYTAQADSIPILCFTGQAPRALLHREAFQAVDIVAVAAPVSKWAVQVREPAQLPWVVREAFRVARSGRPGPVLIDLPLDVQRAEVEYDPEIDGPLPVFRQPPHPRRIQRALDLLLAAERPLLLLGGGAVLAGACETLVRFAEHLQVPVVPTLMGKGGIPEDHDLYAGMVGIQTNTRAGNQAFLESDLVLAVGARFAERHTGDLDVYRRGRRFIHVDVEPTQIGRVFEPDLGVVADAALAAEALLAEARRRTPPKGATPWVERVAALRGELTRRDDFDEVPVRPQRVMGELNRFFGPDAVFVTAIGLYQIWSGQYQRSFRPRHYLCCGQAGPLGWEVPACIGVKLARPEQTVVGVVGDFSFQFLMEEVAVAVQHRVPYVLVMLNNGYLSLIRQPSKYQYDMNFAVDITYGEDGPGIDHVAAMEAMGAVGVRVTRPEEIAGALAWAVRESERLRVPALVEVMVEREADCSMGPSIDRIVEYAPAGRPVAAGVGD